MPCVAELGLGADAGKGFTCGTPVEKSTSLPLKYHLFNPVWPKVELTKLKKSSLVNKRRYIFFIFIEFDNIGYELPYHPGRMNCTFGQITIYVKSKKKNTTLQIYF